MKKSVIIKKKKLQNHVSVETSLKMIFDFDVPVHDLRNEFYHFAALKDFDYSFTSAVPKLFKKFSLADLLQLF